MTPAAPQISAVCCSNTASVWSKRPELQLAIVASAKTLVGVFCHEWYISLVLITFAVPWGCGRKQFSGNKWQDFDSPECHLILTFQTCRMGRMFCSKQWKVQVSSFSYWNYEINPVSPEFHTVVSWCPKNGLVAMLELHSCFTGVLNPMAGSTVVLHEMCFLDFTRLFDFHLLHST